MRRILVIVSAVCFFAPLCVTTVGRADDKGSPIFGVTIPAGYRQWELIARSDETGLVVGNIGV